MRYLILLSSLLTASAIAVGQVTERQAKKDSIQNAIEVAENDSLKIEALRELGVLTSKTDMSKAVFYLEQAIDLSDSKKLDYLKISATNSLGITYYGMGDYEKALECFYEVLVFYEKNEDKSALSKIYNNVGLILDELGRIEESIEYFEKALAIKIETNDDDIASVYSNLGLAYHQRLKDYQKAAVFFRKALALDRSNNDHYGLFVSYGNIGKNFFHVGKLDSAEYYYNKAVMLIDRLDDQYLKAELLCDFAKVNAAQKRYGRAIEKHNMSLDMAEKVGAKLILRNNYQGLAEVYSSLGNYKSALNYQKKYTKVNEEIFNEDKNDKIAVIETNFQVRSKQNEIALLKKEAEIKDLRLSNREMALYWLGGFFLLVAMAVVLQYRKTLYKGRINKILELKNEEINTKNKNIMDSILYAKNIQEAILPEEEKLKAVFNDAFVLTKPRDVVNGDFYWFSEDDNKIVMAAVDCTGHGVPAAFLNVIGNSLLNQIVNEEKILEPAEILKRLNLKIFKNLKYSNMQHKANDGMDIALCLFDRATQKLSFAGAKRPLYFFHDNELNILKGDQFAVGGILHQEHREYRQHELILQPNDSIYLFTDGIVDQFGGEENKKFMYPRFKALLKSVAHDPMEKQLAQIEQKINQWQGSNEQTDDMLLIGVRI